MSRHVTSRHQGHRDVTSPDGTTHRELPDGTVEVEGEPARAGGARGDVLVSGERGTQPPSAASSSASGRAAGGGIHPKLMAAAARASPGRW